MKKKLALICLSLLWSCQEEASITYPETKQQTVVDTYFDTKVVDNYRWLEDDLSEETADWVQNQNDLTFDQLDKIPFRKELKGRLEALWNFEKISAPFQEGDFTYFYKNEGLQNQYVLYRYRENKEEASVFLDPNTFAEDGTTSLLAFSFLKMGAKQLMLFQKVEAIGGKSL